jgi:hypothetical protein
MKDSLKLKIKTEVMFLVISIIAALIISQLIDKTIAFIVFLVIMVLGTVVTISLDSSIWD